MKDNVFFFLKAVPYLEKISDALQLKLADRFKINSDPLKILIQIVNKTGGFYEN